MKLKHKGKGLLAAGIFGGAMLFGAVTHIAGGSPIKTHKVVLAASSQNAGSQSPEGDGDVTEKTAVAEVKTDSLETVGGEVLGSQGGLTAEEDAVAVADISAEVADDALIRDSDQGTVEVVVEESSADNGEETDASEADVSDENIQTDNTIVESEDVMSDDVADEVVQDDSNIKEKVGEGFVQVVDEESDEAVQTTNKTGDATVQTIDDKVAEEGDVSVVPEV